MKTNRNVLFSHIPKTGGVTMRIILNRVYGTDKVFLINSTDISESLNVYNCLTAEEREKFTVVAGHGAELFRPLMDDPFRLTILREPVSLFLSQYYYLKVRQDTSYYHEVRGLASVEEYLDYAIEKGQDNLLTRYLSNSVHFLADPQTPVPGMRQEGDSLLALAIKSLHEYDAIIDLADFDAGIFSLAGKLGWKNIPLYRPSNRNKNNPGPPTLPLELYERLKEVLKWDIALYEEFKNSGLAAGNSVEKGAMKYKLFQARQKGIGYFN